MANVRIRAADLADAGVMQHIEDSCFQTDRIKPRQMRYLLTRARAVNLVAASAAGVCGYCSCLTPGGRRPARLYSLAVLPQSRGAGLARKLMLELFRQVQGLGYNRIRLEVRESATAVQAFYRRLGFAEIGRIDDYYEDGEAALRMEAWLSRADVPSSR